MTCFTYNNASVGIIATGPQPIPYLYSVYEVFNPLNITQGNLGITSGLSLGNYVALVEDDLGCLDRDTFIIQSSMIQFILILLYLIMLVVMVLMMDIFKI